ncbi:MAG: hypothetical protein ETSY2_19490 [Candidatus Entotheonella gemina]|uniref:Uncharacterized protein n=1 Tax=Candidatus Entotheonella gemina TaxID=1429439 RepID=W4M777_9BACT|nr:MAG: hypothetical protein ETSY2_19490 [Candidatus Entotheonella gemina]
MAGLRLTEFRQLQVVKLLKTYLTVESFEKVQGRYQIAIFQVMK